MLGGQVVHELAPPASDGFDGAGAVPGVYEDGLPLGTHQVAADFDKHVIMVEGVGIALSIGEPKRQPQQWEIAG